MAQHHPFEAGGHPPFSSVHLAVSPGLRAHAVLGLWLHTSGSIMAQLWALGKALHPLEPSVSDSVKGGEEGHCFGMSATAQALKCFSLVPLLKCFQLTLIILIAALI